MVLLFSTSLYLSKPVHPEFKRSQAELNNGRIGSFHKVQDTALDRYHPLSGASLTRLLMGPKRAGLSPSVFCTSNSLQFLGISPLQNSTSHSSQAQLYKNIFHTEPYNFMGLVPSGLKFLFCPGPKPRVEGEAGHGDFIHGGQVANRFPLFGFSGTGACKVAIIGPCPFFLLYLK